MAELNEVRIPIVPTWDGEVRLAETRRRVIVEADYDVSHADMLRMRQQIADFLNLHVDDVLVVVGARIQVLDVPDYSLPEHEPDPEP